MMARLADVAQLARASACHAEGRGFESLHPLLEDPLEMGVFSAQSGTLMTCYGPEVRF
jgi:hypothetical protein